MKNLLSLTLVFCLWVTTNNYALAEDSVLASVDGRPITLYDLNSYNPSLKLKNINEFKSSATAKETLEFLILQQLIVSEAEKYRITANSEEISQALNELIGQNNLSEQEFQAKLKSRGEDLDTLKEQIKIEILKNKLAAKLFRSSAVIKDEEVEAVLEASPNLKKPGTKIKLRQIFISGDAANQKMQEIIKAIQAGNTFESMASRYSMLDNAKRGGAVGIVAEEDLDPHLFEALMIVEAGKISQVIQAEQGLSLFKVDQRITVTESFDELKQMIRADLTSSKERENFSDYFSRKIYQDHAIERIVQ